MSAAGPTRAAARARAPDCSSSGRAQVSRIWTGVAPVLSLGLWVGAVSLAEAAPALAPPRAATSSGAPSAAPASGAPAGKPPAAAGVQWVRIKGGVFEMGSNRGERDELPRRRVSVPAFELSRSEVTVGQYRACVEAGQCAAPATHGACNWLKSGREDHPINCVTWDQASAFAAWIGARLPTEAEWEYAARSGGRPQTFPWGDAEATCQRAMMRDPLEGNGCGAGSTTAPVCSRPRGHSAQGLCDLAGNVWEWVADAYGSYAEAPADGSARVGTEDTDRVLRGGGWYEGIGSRVRPPDREVSLSSHRAAARFQGYARLTYDFIGFRVAR